MRQTVVVVAPAGGSLFEIATPLRVWGPDPGEPDWPDTDLVCCGVDDERIDLALPPLVLGGLRPLREHARRADLIIIPTWPPHAPPAPASLLAELRAAHARGCRIVGLCLGAFPVAEAGLLDGCRAVTHWRYADEFARRFPSVISDPDPLYLDLGSVVTSAGSAAAIDCCVHLIRADHGAAAAALVARSLVTAPWRTGGQSQYALVAPLSGSDDLLGGLLGTVTDRLGEVRSVSELVARSAMSRRTLERLFRDRLGCSPRVWLTGQRVQAARTLLETTGLDVESVARRTGFGSAPALRREFRRALGVAPVAYRRTFQLAPP